MHYFITFFWFHYGISTGTACVIESGTSKHKLPQQRIIGFIRDETCWNFTEVRIDSVSEVSENTVDEIIDTDQRLLCPGIHNVKITYTP